VKDFSISPAILKIMTDHVDFMAEALKQSKLASKDGELPFGELS
jgi:tRNA(Arg) A34 adenosine deaminase TadA